MSMLIQFKQSNYEIECGKNLIWSTLEFIIWYGPSNIYLQLQLENQILNN